MGRLGGDAETRYTTSGVAVSTLNVATSTRQKKGEQWEDVTHWFRLTLWRHEGLLQYLKKGRQVFVTGHLEQRVWEDKEGKKNYSTDLIVDDIELAGQRGDNGGGEKGEAKPPAKQSARQETRPPAPDIDDDVPF